MPRPFRHSFVWTSAAKEAFLADIGEESAMDDEYRELAHRLFAAATAMLEDALDLAVAGQSPRQSPSRLAKHGCRLRAAAHDLAVIAEAATIAANRAVNHASDQPRNRR
ncbi:MAG: hypothetical protein L0Y72_17370 [Gemmataceae bacterium]|nr:hypothetical protein [Gemmataceae bacterium]